MPTAVLQACAYETVATPGSWLPVLRELTDPFSQAEAADQLLIPLVQPGAEQEVGTPTRRRVDVKVARDCSVPDCLPA